jgi:hypothetical protein
MEFSMAQKGEDLGMRHGHEALAAIKIWWPWIDFKFKIGTSCLWDKENVLSRIC